MITSASNSTFKHLKTLLNSKGLKKSDQCLVSGRHLVPEILKTQDIEAVIFDGELPDPIKSRVGEIPILIFKSRLFNELDTLGTGFPILLCRQKKIEGYDWSRPLDAAILPVGDPQNLGSIIRCAAAFSIPDIVLLKDSCHPFLPKVTKAAAGLNFSVSIFHTEAVDESHVIALDLQGENIHQVEWPHPAKILLGEEGPGVPPSSHLKRVQIPISPSCESLNVAVSAGVAFFAMNRAR